MSGIYIHIPFCKQACYYCDFHFSTNLQLKDSLVQSIISEIDLRQDYLVDDKVETIYFGGGTPSLLSPSELGRILGQIKHRYLIDSDVEITLEANPDDLTASNFKCYLDLGINRLSIGIQSFDNQILGSFNRVHDAEIAISAVQTAQRLGLENLSVDLIFGAPNESLEQLQNDLHQIEKLGVPHVSIYGMTIEEDTVFGRWYQKGRLRPLDEDKAADQFELIMARLGEMGYAQYEISNFAKHGYESRHNSSYWQGKHYLGVGPAAHSYNGHSRQYNIPNNAKYIKSISAGVVPAEVEILGSVEKINEYILTRLRLMDGMNLEHLEATLAYNLRREQSQQIEHFIESELIRLVNNHMILTEKGKLLADSIIEKLII